MPILKKSGAVPTVIPFHPWGRCVKIKTVRLTLEDEGMKITQDDKEMLLDALDDIESSLYDMRDRLDTLQMTVGELEKKLEEKEKQNGLV